MKIQFIIKKYSRWLTLIIIVISSFMSFLDSTIINVIMPSITKSFEDGIEKSEWLISGYILSMSIMLLSSGWFARKYGSKTVYIIGIIIFTVASFMCSIASSMNSLITMRVIQGIGSGIITPLSISIIAHNFKDKYRGLAIGLVIMAIGLSVSVGPLIGGYFVEINRWDLAFSVNVPIGICLVITALILMKNQVDKLTPRFDYIGVVLLLIWAPLSLYILSFNYKWQLILILIIAFGLFILRMIYAKSPLINIRIFKNRNFVLAFIVMLCFGVILQGGGYILSEYLLHGLNYTAYETGLIFVPTGIIQGAIAPLIGSLTRKFGDRIFILIGLLVILIYLYINSQLELNSPHWHIMLALYLKGFGIGLSFTAITNLALNGAKQDEIDSVSGVINMVKQLAGSFAIAITTTIMVNNSNENGTIDAQGYLAANDKSFMLMSVVTLIAIIAVLLIRKNKKDIVNNQ